MKRAIMIFFNLLIFAELFASGAKELPNWATTENLYKNVQKQLGHEIEKHEQTIIDTAYLYYYNKCGGNWTQEIWDTTIEKSVELCKNPVAVTAAKAGVFGEKLLKSLVVTTEDIISGVNNWIESGYEEYQKRHD